MNDQQALVLGQKYAYATAALVVGITSFIGLLGMEKAIVAVIFGWLALRPSPAPALADRRGTAITGMVLGALVLVGIPIVVLTNLPRLQMVVSALKALQDAR
jgi:hypothetical protein